MTRKLLFLGCNHAQVPYLKIIKSLDWEIVGIDLNVEPPGKVLCDKFYNIGYDNLNGLIGLGEKEGFTQNDKIFTAAAQFAHKGAAHFAKYFNIPYVSEKTVDLCLDKAAYYEYFKKNDIPIPNTWYVNNENVFKNLISSMGEPKWYYLKSDYSKNPNYVYRINSGDVHFEKIFWGQDRYLREFYILQEEFAGVSLRINVFGDRFNVFDFLTGEKTNIHHNKILALNIVQTLKQFIKKQGMQNWLVKFDIILSDNEYVVLDIGLDPPSRMLKESKENKINFEKYYVAQYLLGKVEYPHKLD